MKAAIIGAGAESLHTIEIAQKYKVTVVALDGNGKAEGLKAADRAEIVDISRQEETLKVLEKEKIDFVLTAPIGRYLTTIGYVNERLQLPGITEPMASLCTDKFLFHQKMAENGLRSCWCYNISRGMAEEAAGSGSAETEEMDKETFPAILKPRFGSGSRGIHFVNNQEELKEALALIGEEPYVLEECVAGEEYGLDGAVIGGRFYLVLLRHKENTPLPVRQAVAYFSVPPTEVFWGKVKEFMEKTISVLGLNECLLHADIIRTKETPFLVELSARPSGHNLHNLFTPLVTGIDMAEEYIRYRLGMDYSFVPEKTKQMMIHYFDFQGKVREVPQKSQIEEKLGISFAAWECNIREGDLLVSVTDGHSLMGRGYFILEGRGEEELRKLSEKVKGFFEISEC